MIIRNVRWLSILIIAFFVFSSYLQAAEPNRALFVSVIQNLPVLSSRGEITRLVDFAKQANVKILFVQIYRANQSWFPSQVADPAPYEKCLKGVGEDPFALLIKEAHKEGIEVHAWLNLLSLSANINAPLLKKYGPEVLTRNLKEKNKLEDYKIDNQYFLEPSDAHVRADLAKIVQEILAAYPNLDGIQFDYIRYPDTEPHYGYSADNVQRFKKTNGLKMVDEKSPVWQDWRRKQVTELLTQLVKIVRSQRPLMKVSTTGCLPYVRALYEAYQDWPSWVNSDLVDFVTIMDYSPDPKEFMKFVNVAKTHVTDTSKIKISVGAYKLVNSPEVFQQEFHSCEQLGQPCAIFHYGSLLENPALKTSLTRP